MEFNVYDMLVFEDEDENIYQDCVCEISDGTVYIASSEDEYNKIIEYSKIIECNDFALYFDCNGTLCNIDTNRFADEHKYKLKEIWTRVDEDTYKKVWSK